MKDKDTYGIKVSMDISDFNKGADKIKEKVKDIETKVKINTSNIDYEFKDKFKNTGIEQLNKQLEIAKKNLNDLWAKANKADYNEMSGVTEVSSAGSIDAMNNYKKALAEVMELEDEIQSRMPEITLDKETEESIKFMAQDVSDLNNRLIELYSQMNMINKVGITTPEQEAEAEKLRAEIEKIIARIRELGGTPYVLKNSLEETTNEAQEVSKKMDEINSKSGGVGNNLSGAFTRATKSLRRFALSLFGIRSIFSAISRAMRTYMSQNDAMRRKMEAVWNGLGTLLAPVVEFLANLFLKLLGYINVFTKALWNFDFIAKANANTLKNYQKQVKKTTQALAGIDELTNINQDTGNDDDYGPNLIEIPELNSKIVQKLQELAEWLRKNKKLLKKVGEALLLAFGAVAIGKILKNLGDLFGTSSGTGLLGLQSILSWLAVLGVIAITIKIIYNIVHKEDMDNLEKGLEDTADTAEGVTGKFDDMADNLSNVTKNAKKGSKEVANYNNVLKDQITNSAQIIDSMDDHIDELDLLELAYLKIGGGLDTYNEQQKSMKKIMEVNGEQIDKAIVEWQKLYNQGKLNKEQTKEYKEIMQLFGYEVDGSKMSVYKYWKILQQYGFDEKEIYQIITKNKDAYGLLATKISEVGKKAEVSKDQVQKLYDRLNEITRKKYGIDIQTKFGVDASAITNVLNSFKNMGIAKYFGMDKIIDRFLASIPGFAIGTDLVKSDGLAYLHAGEKVVPASAVGGGYTGNDNETNNLLRELIVTVQEKNFSATISSDAVGRASVDYIRNQNRIMGGSII